MYRMKKKTFDKCCHIFRLIKVLTMYNKRKCIRKNAFSNENVAISADDNIKADLHGTIFAYDCRMRFL